MDGLVLFEVALCGEPTITVGALERSLLRVRPHVDLQPAGTTEHLEANPTSGPAPAHEKVGR